MLDQATTASTSDTASPPVEKLPAHVLRYQEWQADPTPERLRAAVDTLSPVIDYSMRQTGQADDPYLRAKARVVAAEAIKTYNPESGSALPTWTSQQLIRMRRIARQSNVTTRIPERVQLDSWAINQADAQFFDEHDREADLDDLSDMTGLSKRRITEVRRAAKRTPGEAALGDLTLAPHSPQYADEAVSAVYADLDATDRKLLEMKTGYGGKYEPMPPQQIGRALNLSPTQVSRRSARIAMRINELEDALSS